MTSVPRLSVEPRGSSTTVKSFEVASDSQMCCVLSLLCFDTTVTRSDTVYITNVHSFN